MTVQTKQPARYSYLQPRAAHATAPICVMKFGSSVLSDMSKADLVAQAIYQQVRAGARVVAVVSAIGDTTDALISELDGFDLGRHNSNAYAAFVATGEIQSAALLQLSLDRAGILATTRDTRSLLTCRGDRLDADPTYLDRAALDKALTEHHVVVVPGFIGAHVHGGTALLGRGGSDLSAIYIAEKLGAEACVLVKDVDGVYIDDPGVTTHRFDTVTYDDARFVSDGLIQPRAIDALEANKQRVIVTDLFSASQTIVGASRSHTSQRIDTPPSRVILIGCGVVGERVFERLSHPELPFEIVGVGVKNLGKERGVSIPAKLITRDLDELLSRPHDVIVEVTSDPDLARRIALDADRRGVTTITASKILAATLGHALPTLRFSASAGGAAPVLETIDRALALEHKQIDSIEGVLNGTCNFILDRVRDGVPFDRAVEDAIDAGFAEADPSRDIDGTDTADKLEIIAQRAFGLHLDRIDQEGIEHVIDDGQRRRLIGRIDRHGDASVKPTLLDPSHPFFDLDGELNAAVIRFVDGEEWFIHGKGAGGAPTASAVIADLLDARASGELAPNTDSGPRYGIEGPEDAPLIVCLGGISATARASEWWGGVVGDGCSVDTSAYRVLSVDWCARDIEDASFSVDEHARALHELLAREGLRAHAIIGASFGGLVAQRLLELDPAITDHVIILAAAHRPHPFASGLRHIQRSILRRGAREDVALARALAMLTYRSALEFGDRFTTPDQVASYLDYNGAQITGRFSAKAYVGLSSAIDAFSSAPRTHTQHLTLIGFDTDILAPPQLLEELHDLWGGTSTLEIIPTRFGHDGFLKETEHVTRAITNALGGNR